MIYLSAFVFVAGIALLGADLLSRGARGRPADGMPFVIALAVAFSSLNALGAGTPQGWPVQLGLLAGLCLLLYLCAIFGAMHWTAHGSAPHVARLGWRLSRDQLVLAATCAGAGAVYSLGFYHFLGLPVGSLRPGVGPGEILVLYGGSLGPAIAEEMVFRYYLQGRLARLFRRIPTGDALACLGAAGAFAMMHLDGAHSVLRWLQVLPLGLAFGFLFLRGGLPLAVVGHGLTNFFIYTFVILKSSHP